MAFRSQVQHPPVSRDTRQGGPVVLRRPQARSLTLPAADGRRLRALLLGLGLLLILCWIGREARAARTDAPVGEPAAGQSAEAVAAWPTIALVPFLDGVANVVQVTHAGDGTGRIFVVQQAGYVRLVIGGVLQATRFLDIHTKVVAGGEQGLLSIAFPPGFAAKQYFYVNYTRAGDGATVISRIPVSADPNVANPAGEQVLLVIPQPYANHNGGQLAFGPDGYLYIGMGDGGSSNDPQGNGQKMSTLLGKLLRIDVESGGRPYAVPSSNPFVGKQEVRPEIWASGLRNPWRFSFDRATGDLFIADVGQNRLEEVNVQPASSKGGENYGWNILEGSRCLRSKTCDTTRLVLPVAEYGHDRGCSVTGGMVYRGKALPRLQGTYLYGDYCSGRIWGMRREAGRWTSVELADTRLSISTFGEDEAGEVYVADHGKGGIYRLEER